MQRKQKLKQAQSRPLKSNQAITRFYDKTGLYDLVLFRCFILASVGATEPSKLLLRGL